MQHDIYERGGDTITFCMDTPGRPRPTEFKTKAGEGGAMTVWRRRQN